MRRYLPLLILVTILIPARVQAQEYVAPEVVVSSEMANVSGKIFYIHKVAPKQTVFSICKAYGVSQEQLLEANPSLKDGLKAGSVILIPKVENLPSPEPEVQDQTPEQVSEQTRENKSQPQVNQDDGKTEEQVARKTEKWYDKLLSIFKNKKNDKSRKSSSDSQERTYDPFEIGSDSTILTTTRTDAENVGNMPNLTVKTVYTESRPLRMSLILPFNASAAPSSNYLDFYSGVLMALRELKTSGRHVELAVYDLKASNPLADGKLKRSDLIVGPVHSSAIGPYAEFAKENEIPLVSPMDVHSDRFLEGNPYFFLAPAVDSIRMDNMIRSLNVDNGNEKVYLFYNSTLKEAKLVNRIKSKLDEAGITYNNIAYNILTGRELGQRLGSQWARRGMHKIIVASEDEAFAPDVLRNLKLIAKNEVQMEIFCSNALRGFESSIDFDTFYLTGAHICAPYWVNYDDSRTNSFLMSYRALFQTEPTAYSYQGYDITKYFVEALNACGGDISRIGEIPESESLQCNFRFVRKDEKSGWQNAATRNLVYLPDFTITLDD